MSFNIRLEALKLLHLSILLVRITCVLRHTRIVILMLALLRALVLVCLLTVDSWSHSASRVYCSVDYFVDVRLFRHATCHLIAGLSQFIDWNHSSWIYWRNQSILLS